MSTATTESPIGAIEQTIEACFLRQSFDKIPYQIELLEVELCRAGMEYELRSRVEGIREKVILDKLAEAEKLADKGAGPRNTPAYSAPYAVAKSVAIARISGHTPDQDRNYDWVEKAYKMLNKRYAAAMHYQQSAASR